MGNLKGKGAKFIFDFWERAESVLTEVNFDKAFDNYDEGVEKGEDHVETIKKLLGEICEHVKTFVDASKVIMSGKFGDLNDLQRLYVCTVFNKGKDIDRSKFIEGNAKKILNCCPKRLVNGDILNDMKKNTYYGDIDHPLKKHTGFRYFFARLFGTTAYRNSTATAEIKCINNIIDYVIRNNHLRTYRMQLFIEDQERLSVEEVPVPEAPAADAAKPVGEEVKEEEQQLKKDDSAEELIINASIEEPIEDIPSTYWVDNSCWMNAALDAGFAVFGGILDKVPEHIAYTVPLIKLLKTIYKVTKEGKKVDDVTMKYLESNSEVIYKDLNGILNDKPLSEEEQRHFNKCCSYRAKTKNDTAKLYSLLGHAGKRDNAEGFAERLFRALNMYIPGIPIPFVAGKWTFTNEEGGIKKDAEEQPIPVDKRKMHVSVDGRVVMKLSASELDGIPMSAFGAEIHIPPDIKLVQCGKEKSRGGKELYLCPEYIVFNESNRHYFGQSIDGTRVDDSYRQQGNSIFRGKAKAVGLSSSRRVSVKQSILGKAEAEVNGICPTVLVCRVVKKPGKVVNQDDIELPEPIVVEEKPGDGVGEVPVKDKFDDNFDAEKEDFNPDKENNFDIESIIKEEKLLHIPHYPDETELPENLKNALYSDEDELLDISYGVNLDREVVEELKRVSEDERLDKWYDETQKQQQKKSANNVPKKTEPPSQIEVETAIDNTVESGTDVHDRLVEATLD